MEKLLGQLQDLIPVFGLVPPEDRLMHRVGQHHEDNACQRDDDAPKEHTPFHHHGKAQSEGQQSEDAQAESDPQCRLFHPTVQGTKLIQLATPVFPGDI